MQDAITVAVTGDLVLDEPDADYWLAGIAPALRKADLAIGHLEVPHTNSTVELAGDVPAPGAPIANLGAIRNAGFNMLSLAGNHIADCGAQGIAETIGELDRLGLSHSGAGLDISEARSPAHSSVYGQAIALLSYNCIGPETGWATEKRAGCAYLPFDTVDGAPVTPLAVLQSFPPEALEILSSDIAAARDNGADHVIVALHKGIVHTPAHIAPYERKIARAAIECGADAVISHHAHIVRGIEFHLGRPIFHGLGNGCVVTSALAPDQDHEARRDWARRRKEMFGFEPDPAYSLAPFHPEAVNAFIGKLVLNRGAPPTAAIVPVHVVPPGRPELADSKRAGEICRYVEKISVDAGLPAISIDANGMIEVAA